MRRRLCPTQTRRGKRGLTPVTAPTVLLRWAGCTCKASIVAKYDPLFEFLCRAGDGPVTVSFDEIERLVGGLPKSASTHRAWWSNEADGGSHVQSRAWLNTGRQVESVDVARRLVRFSTAGWTRGS